MIKIINYIDLCSSAFLNAIDQMSLNGDQIMIDLSNRETKQLFDFYLNSQLQQQRQFGYHNVVINSCNPDCNWRNDNNVTNEKYIVNDQSVLIEPQSLQMLLESRWKKLKKQQKQFIFIYQDNVDIDDMTKCILRIIGTTCINDKSRFYILKDGNDIFCHQQDVPSYVVQQIEQQLRTNNLVL